MLKEEKTLWKSVKYNVRKENKTMQFVSIFMELLLIEIF